jgi:hypothetical protein
MEVFMATVYRYFDKDTFEPEKNYFSTERVRYSRLEVDPEVRLDKQSDKWRAIGFHCIGWGCIVGLIFMLTFGTLGSLFSSWFYFGAGFGAFLFVGGIIFASAVCWPKEQQYAEELRKYRDKHEEELWMYATEDLRAYNEAQQKIAEAWRAVHPLEEKIRACLLDPKSSVDVANLARYYAEVYLTEKKNDESQYNTQLES